MKYNWQLKDWTHFRYDLAEIQESLLDCVSKIGLFAGGLAALGVDVKQESIIHFMVAEALKTSAIEGEVLSREDVFSSIRNQFGLNDEKSKDVKDYRAVGISRVMVDAYNSFEKPLSKRQLNEWHAMLFKESVYMGCIGEYRKHAEPMQVVAGPIEKRKVHFEAPPSSSVAKEMSAFIKWFNDTAPGGVSEIKIAPVRAGIAHLYFESIHPYEDGNGRIGRAIAEKALAQGLGRPALLCISQEIEAHRKLYYSALQEAQKSNEITEWLRYFIEMLTAASIRSSNQIEFIVRKSKFFDRFAAKLNARQKKVISRMLEEGAEGFEGGINARKYGSISKCSKATATRDLTEMLEMKVLKLRPGGGRSVSYDLALASPCS